MNTPAALMILSAAETDARNANDKFRTASKRFGLTVRNERRKRKISLQLFARSLGYTTTMVSYLESGRRIWPSGKAELAMKLLTRREDWPD